MLNHCGCLLAERFGGKCFQGASRRASFAEPQGTAPSGSPRWQTGSRVALFLCAHFRIPKVCLGPWMVTSVNPEQLIEVTISI